MADKKKIAEGAQKALVGTGKFVQSNAIPLLYVGGVVVAIVILRKVVKSISSFGKEDRSALRPEEAKVDDSKASISESQAKIYANQLFDSMNSYGTNESTIKGVFEKITPDDFKKVYNAFGRKPYTSTFIGGGTPTATSMWLGDYEDADLIFWMRKELSDTADRSTVAAIRQVVEPAGFVF